MLERVASGLKKVVFPTSRVVGVIGMSMLVLMTLFTVVDVISRRVFNSPLRGSHELVELTFAIVVFLTLAYCATKNGHIEVDALVRKFPKMLQATVGSIILLVTTGTLGLVSWQLMKHGMNLQRMKQETVALEIIAYPFVYLAAIGALLITLVYLIQFIYSLNRFRGG